MDQQTNSNHHQLELAASRALELISHSAHARSLQQPTTPTPTPTPANNNNNNLNNNLNNNPIQFQSNVLDIFMSPDKPKSRLRQLAQSSAKKFNHSKPNPSTTDPELQPEFVLNLGIPTKPQIDPKIFKLKPPTKRSLGPRRSSLVSRRSLSPTKPSFENLLDDLAILPSPEPNSTQSPTKSNSAKPRSTRSAKLPSSQTSNTTTRKSRRVTIVHVSTNLDLDPSENLPLSNTLSESVECNASDHCEDHLLDHQAGSTCSNDSFDPNSLLIPKPEAEDTADEPEIKEEEEERKDRSVVVLIPRWPSKRKQANLKSKRLIQDTDNEEENHQTPTSPKLNQSSNTRVTADQKQHHRQTSSQASHNTQPNSTLIDVDCSSSDDSIEILPARALRFQKLRALAKSSRHNELPNCDPCDEATSNEIHPYKKITPDDRRSEFPSSTNEEEAKKIKPKKTVKSAGPSSSKPSDPTSTKIKKPATTESKEPTKATGTKGGGERQGASQKGAGSTKKAVPFAKVRDDLAEELIEELDELVFDRRLPAELELVWSKRLNTTAGRAKWTIMKDSQGAVVREKVQIELSTKVIDTEMKLRNTLAHELCHVACWFIDRQKHEKHGKFFKAWAAKIQRTLPDVKVTTKHDYEISYKFNWACTRPGCGHVYGRHSNSIDPLRHRCTCSGSLLRLPRNAPLPPPAGSLDAELAGRLDALTVSV